MKDWEESSRQLRTRLKEVGTDLILRPEYDVVWSGLAGTITFGSTLALSTFVQWRLLGLSTGSVPPLPTIAGVVTVCAASLASHHVATSTYVYRRNVLNRTSLSKLLSSFDFDTMRSQLHDLQQQQIEKFKLSSKTSNGLGIGNLPIFNRSSHANDSLNLHFVQIPWHTIRICAVGLIVFRILGGRFWAIAPSSLTHVGSFARVSIPATDAYATPSQRLQIELLGRRFGCHTCGNKMRSYRKFALPSTHSFVGDHMPPKSVAMKLANRWDHQLKYKLFKIKPLVSFRFYPQCVKCSGRQGRLLAQATGRLRQAQQYQRIVDFARKPLIANNPWIIAAATQLRNAGGGSRAYYHGWRMRWNHWTGGAIAYLAYKEAQTYDKDWLPHQIRILTRDFEDWTMKQLEQRKR